MRSLVADGEQDALNRYKRATQNLLFADGRQHIDWSLRDKNWKDLPTNDGRVRVTMNYIRPILRSRTQRLMSSELSWRAVPRSNEHEERDRAMVGANLVKARWNAAELDAKVRLALFLADNCGVAFLKQFWNPAIGPLTQATVVLSHPVTQELTTYPVSADGRPIADDQGNPLDGSEMGYSYRPGDVDTALRTIFNVRVNPDAWGVEVSEGFRWLLDSEVVPISVVKERWGERARKVTNAEGIGMMRQYERIVRSIAGRQGSAGPGGDLLSNRDGQKVPDKDTTLLTEYWEAPSESMPQGRLIITAGDELLFPIAGEDQEGLPQGFVPFVPIYSERRPLDAYGRPVVDDLIAPQKVVNRQWGCVLEEMGLSGVGQWAMFDIPGLSDQITNQAGAHIKIPQQTALGGRAIGDLVQRLNPASTSPDRWRMIDAAKATMFDIGAFHEIQRGQVPPGVDSGIAVQLLQEAENGQMHDAVRTLKRSLIRWGRQTGRIAKWGYGENEQRWIPQHRADLDYLVEAVTGTDLPDFEEIDLDLEGFRPTSQAALNAEVKEGMKEGYIEPRQGLQLMDLGRGVQGLYESETRHYSRARRENLAIEKKEYQVIPSPPGSPQAQLGVLGAFLHPDGGSFALPQDDDHLVHIAIHQELLLDDTRPLPVRQAAGLHIAEHRAFLQAQIVPQPKPSSDTPPSPDTGTSESRAA